MHVIVRHTGHHLRRHVRRVWESRGGGFYGFVAALMFIYLEASSFVGDVAALPGFRVSLAGVLGWIVQNLVTGMLNVVWASIWPVAWIQRFGVSLTSAALLIGAFVVFRLIHPAVLRLLREPGEAEVPPATGA